MLMRMYEIFGVDTRCHLIDKIPKKIMFYILNKMHRITTRLEIAIQKKT